MDHEWDDPQLLSAPPAWRSAPRDWRGRLEGALSAPCLVVQSGWGPICREGRGGMGDGGFQGG